MGDESDRETASDDSAAVENRVWRNIFAVIALAIVAAAIFADLKFMLGLALGGGLALLNYRWLHASLRAALAVGGEKAPPGTIMKFVFRWMVIAVAVFFAYRTRLFDPVAILTGLFAPALAVIIEAVYFTYKTLAHDGER